MRKAFTLIELLAVIIVLAIVALVATPLLLDVIEDSRKSAAKSSTALILDAAKLYYTENYFKNEGDFQEYECSYNDRKGCDALVLNGEKPDSGTLKISSTGVVNGKITYGKYTHYICNNNVSEIESDGCSFVNYELIYDITEDGIITGFKQVETVSMLNVLLPVVNALELTPQANDYLKDKKITIPEYIGDIEVKGIAENAFSAYGLDVVVLLPKRKLIISENSFQPVLETLYVRKGFKEYYLSYAIEIIEMDWDKTDSIKVSISKNIEDEKIVLTAVVDMSTLVKEHSYEWYKDGILLEETSNTITTTEAGVYKVKVISGELFGSSKHKVNSYTITYDLNGGEGSIESVTKVEDLSINITDIIPTKEAYKFVGWSVDKTSITPEYQSESSYNKNENITLYAMWKSAIVCKRAKSLHTEICNQTNSTEYCARAGYNKGDKIIYGNTSITPNQLNSGDAFDCDVNGDGTFDSVTERFYYVSDLYDTTNKSFNRDYAVLIYYNNTINGVANNTTSSRVAYNENAINYNGPVTAKTHLPTVTQWKNVNLYNATRKLVNEKGNSTSSNGSYNLPTSFNYSGYAARLLTSQELEKACNITIGSWITGELDNCEYMQENTLYANPSSGTSGPWLETPTSMYYSYVWTISSLHSDIYFSVADTTLYHGTRPVIEVKKTLIDAGDVEMDFPKCGEITGANTTWTNKDVTVSVGCTSGNGCVSDKFTKTFNTTTEVGSITITDNSGFSVECPVDVYIDKQLPTVGDIEITGEKGENDWYISDVTITPVDGSDELSGHLETTVNVSKITEDTASQTIVVTTKDKAGNSVTKEYTVKVDKTVPTVSISSSISNNKYLLTPTITPSTTESGYTYKWYKNGSVISGATSSSYSASSVGKYKVEVNAGNGKKATSNEITINGYTISYNVNGGSGSVSSTSKPEGLSVNITSTVPTKSGYDFMGWATTSDATTVEYGKGVAYDKDEDITLYAVWQKSRICRRATTLHTEVCNKSSNYCAAYGPGNGKTITYGNTTTTTGVLKSGDAFDCDVNGDGVYDSSTERFYYVSPLYNTTSKSFDSNYAVLSYYITSSKSAYDDDGDNQYGPYSAKNMLPTTSKWPNVKLLSTPRAIITDEGGNTVGNGKYNLPTDYTYSGYAARLLTTQELGYACGITVGSKTNGELKKCLYLLENTAFSGATSVTGSWLENPNKSSNAWRYQAANANVLNSITGSTISAVRPVIEVKLEDISY